MNFFEFWGQNWLAFFSIATLGSGVIFIIIYLFIKK